MNVPVVVVAANVDGTTVTHRFTSDTWPSVQLLPNDGRKRAVLLLRDRRGRTVGAAHYADAGFVLVGTCVDQVMPAAEDQPSATDGGNEQGDPA